MGNEFGYMSMVRVKSVVLMAGATFALVLFAQLFNLQDFKSFSSLFSAEKIDVEQGSFIDHNISRNSTFPSVLDAANANVGDLVSTATQVSDEMVIGESNVKDDSDPENMFSGESNVKDDSDPESITSFVDTSDDPEDEFPSKDDSDPENIKTFVDPSDDDLDPEDDLPSNDFLELNNNTKVIGVIKDNISKQENPPEFELPASNCTSKSDFSPDHDVVIGRGASAPSNSQFLSTSPKNLEKTHSNDVNSTSLSTSTMGKDAEDMLKKNGNPKILEVSLSNPVNDSAVSSIPAKTERVKKAIRMVVPISKMNDMLLSSYASYNAVKPRWSSAADKELRNVKSMIENATIIEKDPHFDVSMYRNLSAFKRSYELMEKVLKVYVYAEGERPIFHQPHLRGIYASEGWFMKQLKSNKRFLTKNMNKAHLFYLPFNSCELEKALYVRESRNHDNVVQRLSDYVNVIKTKYGSWNRTDGADHFLVACHDWVRRLRVNVTRFMANSIRSLCNTDIIKEGFRVGKDVSLPETNVRSVQDPLRQLGGKPASQRRILAFFAGNIMHGYLRRILLNYWENKDPDMKIFGLLREAKGEMSYVQYMKSSKFCICAKGNEVNSPRVVEAIFYECVPVIISDNFVPPFFEIFNWETFAGFVLEKDIPNLKTILLSISKTRYQLMQQRVKQVQQHFLWHSKPVKYDIFYMILHSIWHNRVFQT
ncbi:putative glycosyltransferase [Dorcoceras hygrometricum]|uniref:Putative glycosyltransferase n=1 Tax=Dorcoceras hygrometricum TaxID=472368 RepID=A0A2Z7D2A3_9LAMI|nr:putative glycosyltransferase [Dorcoceras hygrometricum]